MASKSHLKYVRLLHQKKYREKENVYIAEGIKIVNEALLSYSPVIKMLLFTPENRSQLKPELIPKNIQVIELPSDDFRKISILKNPQGVLIVIQKPVARYPKPSEFGNLVLILDSIRDPGNLGTIIRLADWFGIRNIFCSEDTVECYNPKVVQATMGAIFRVNIYYTALKELLLSLHDSGFTSYGSSLQGENIYTKKLKTPAAVILGNEAHGISTDLLPLIRENILIPNFSKSVNCSESLNVSLAAAIISSEFRRLSV